MNPTKLLIFGNPKAGTPWMISAPTLALDLPLKILVWQDQANKVWVTFNSADYLRSRHGLAREISEGLSIVDSLAQAAAAKAN